MSTDLKTEALHYVYAEGGIVFRSAPNQPLESWDYIRGFMRHAGRIVPPTHMVELLSKEVARLIVAADIAALAAGAAAQPQPQPDNDPKFQAMLGMDDDVQTERLPYVSAIDPAMQAINASAARMDVGIEKLRTDDVSDLDPELLALAEQQTPKRTIMPIMGSVLMSEIPFAMIEPHEAQARSNHGGQSLNTLASRGGLAPSEAIDILEGRRWGSTRPDEAAAFALINKVRAWRAALQATEGGKP